MGSLVRFASGATRHRVALRKSSQLTAIFRQMYKPRAAMISPEAVIKVLNRNKVKFIVMGTHGIGGWRSEPRATQDVDVLVWKSHHRKAVAAIKKAFSDLEVQDLPAVTRFVDPLDGKPVIDLMMPKDDFYREVFKKPVRIGKTHRIPNLEVAIASKYAAMISANRKAEKRHLDAADFVSMVTANYSQIDQDVLFSLGEMVQGGGGTEILKRMEAARAGKTIPI